jgi:hypothetical protein
MFNERDLLTHAGAVQAEVAKALAEARYAEFDGIRRRQAAIDADDADLAALREIEKRLEASDG